MRQHPKSMGLGFVLLLALAGLALSCSSGDSSGILSVSTTGTNDEGIIIVADPAEIVIDTTDPDAPTDPDSGAFIGETALSVTVLDSAGMAMAGTEVAMSTSAGSLASDGMPLTTDENGQVADTLTVSEDDPDTIVVTAAVGERMSSLAITKTVILPNRPPVAEAGDDQTVECASSSGALVTLDGSGSTDPDSSEGTNDDIVSFEWLLDGELLGEGETLETEIPIGTNEVTLRVTDSEGETDSDTVTISIVDTVPPQIAVSVDPSVLWSPNHLMYDIHADVQVLDLCTDDPAVTLDHVTSNEPVDDIGDGSTEPDIDGVEAGTADYDFRVRAERAGPLSGRIYTAQYSVADGSGNVSSASATVLVPHDQGDE